MNKRILLLYGGASSEHEVSLMGYEYVKELLQNTEHEILPVFISREGEWRLGDENGGVARLTYGGLSTEYGLIKIDGALPLLHGEGGEDGTVQGALKTAGIPYVGADVTASAVCIDKFYTKCVASALGIPTVDCVAFSKHTDTETAFSLAYERLGLPMFIKPKRLGSSVGAYPVYTKEDFLALFPLAFEKGGGRVMAERLLQSKRELECAFYEAEGVRLITDPGEILISGFYGYGEKYGGKTATAPTADIDKATREKAKEYSLMLAEALSLRHLARIDFFLTDEGLYFNEINTLPGFTRNSLYPKMLEAAGISPKEAILSFIRDLC